MVSTCANDVYEAPEERATRAGVVRHDWAPTGPATPLSEAIQAVERLTLWLS